MYGVILQYSYHIYRIKIIYNLYCSLYIVYIVQYNIPQYSWRVVYRIVLFKQGHTQFWTGSDSRTSKYCSNK